jgi:hypothetical protein
LRIYVSPVSIDPKILPCPISTPRDYSRKLAAR